MNIKYKEPQFELFPANTASLEDINKPKFLLATLTLSAESIVMLVILGIMIGLFSFSLGVERGKRLAAQSLDERVAAAWNVGGRRLAVATSASVVAVAARSDRTVRSVFSIKPVAAAHVAVARPSITTASGEWTVQVATYKNLDYAKQEALGLKAKGYPVFIIKSRDFYLVCVGQYASQSQAEAFSNKNRSRFQGNQVRRV